MTEKKTRTRTSKKITPPKRKAFRQVFDRLLTMELTNEQLNLVDSDGTLVRFAGKQGLTPGDVMAIVMVLKAMKGDTKAFETVRNTIGEKPSDKPDVNMDEIPKIIIKRWENG